VSLSGSAEELSRTDTIRHLYLGRSTKDAFRSASAPIAPLQPWAAERAS
jgi:hypothetical protein